MVERSVVPAANRHIFLGGTKQMKEQQVGYTFWGRPLYGLERRTAVSIDCDCGELIQQNIQTKQYQCKNCGNCYQFVDQDFQLLNEKNK